MLAVKNMRISKKMTQQALSAASGVPQSLIADIETGKRKNPTINTAMKLAKALNCTVEELVQEDGPKESAM